MPGVATSGSHWKMKGWQHSGSVKPCKKRSVRTSRSHSGSGNNPRCSSKPRSKTSSSLRNISKCTHLVQPCCRRFLEAAELATSIGRARHCCQEVVPVAVVAGCLQRSRCHHRHCCRLAMQVFRGPLPSLLAVLVAAAATPATLGRAAVRPSQIGLQVATAVLRESALVVAALRGSISVGVQKSSAWAEHQPQVVVAAAQRGFHAAPLQVGMAVQRQVTLERCQARATVRMLQSRAASGRTAIQ
mmetsp:Transcript_68306/g.220761  ORF Transcript_68306/g.220761 Transcript_68306/m.220761 type:complete len:244 (+) Transcript_68306:395-1126(+)